RRCPPRRYARPRASPLASEGRCRRARLWMSPPARVPARGPGRPHLALARRADLGLLLGPLAALGELLGAAFGADPDGRLLRLGLDYRPTHLAVLVVARWVADACCP